MRLNRVSALVIVAFATSMAFLGATSASAITSLDETVLCKALEDPCKNGHLSTTATGVILHGKATDPVILGARDILCTTSHVLGETSQLLAHGKITALSWLGCESNGEKCTVTSEHLPLLVKAQLQATHKSYEVLVESGGTGRPAAKTVCEGVTNCSYGANVVLFEVLHVSGVTVLDGLQTLSGEGICFFTSGVWHAKYEVKCLETVGVEVNCYPEMESGSVL